MLEPVHPIQIVASRSGLSMHVIRKWETRYGAVTPTRTDSNRRLYSDEEIERLILLRRLAEHGHGIGFIAKLPTERLVQLVEEMPSERPETSEPLKSTPKESVLFERALEAVRLLDARVLEEVLSQAEVVLGAQGVLQRLIAPLAATIGEKWREGSMTAAQEHFATAVIRVFLGRASKPFAGTRVAPAMVVVTPAGQLHELGALLAGAAASNLGWHITYLGPSLAAADIASAALQNRARAVALSIVYPEDDPNLPAELERLRALLPGVALVVGGRAAFAYRETLDRIGAHVASDLSSLGAILDRLRLPDVGARPELQGNS